MGKLMAEVGCGSEDTKSVSSEEVESGNRFSGAGAWAERTCGSSSHDQLKLSYCNKFNSDRSVTTQVET